MSLALLIGRAQSHPDQNPNGVGTGYNVGLPAAPFFNTLQTLRLESKTHDSGLPSPGATALFSYHDI